MNKKIIVAFIGVGVIIFIGIFFQKSKNDNKFIVNRNTEELERDAKKTEKDINDKLIYRNEKYGFQFYFSEGYENLWKSSEIELKETDAIHAIDFIVDDFELFRIHIRATDWWSENVEVDEEGFAWLKGKRGLQGALGYHLGENEDFVFTSLHNNQSCPDLNEDGGSTLCDLVKDDEIMLRNSFEIIRD
jgi:hypothetical protein